MEMRTFTITRAAGAGTGIMNLRVPAGANGRRRGETPDYAKITVTEQATIGGVAANLNFSIGYAINDGVSTIQRVFSGKSLDNVATSEVGQYTNSDRLLHVKLAGTAATAGDDTNAGVAAFSSWGLADDSMNINFSADNTNALVLKVDFLYLAVGEEIDARWISYTTGGTAIPQTIGFQANVFEALQCYATSSGQFARSGIELVQGMAVFDGTTLEQSESFYGENDGSFTGSIETNHRGVGATNPGILGSRNNTNVRAIENITATTYDVTRYGTGTAIAMFIIAIKCDTQVKLVSGTYNTINQGIAGAGFAPGAAIMCLSSSPVEDTSYTVDTGSVSIGSADLWGQNSLMIHSEDTADPMNTVSRIMDGTLFRSEDNMLPDWEGGISSFTADGMDIVTTEDDIVKPNTFWAFFLEDTSPAASPIPVIQHHRRRIRQ